MSVEHDPPWAQSVLFQIPMRGNEWGYGLSMSRSVFPFQIPMRGNEPIEDLPAAASIAVFQIPMRGNEDAHVAAGRVLPACFKSP